mgnify:CR=1 FL=1
MGRGDMPCPTSAVLRVGGTVDDKHDAVQMANAKACWSDGPSSLSQQAWVKMGAWTLQAGKTPR